MSLVLRFRRLLGIAAIAAVLAAPVIGSAACNGQIATVLSSDAGPDDGSPGGGGAVCTSDPDCNADPTASSLWGSCAAGTCNCNGGYIKQANGKCNLPTAPSTCVGKGGLCLKASDKPPPTYRAAGPGEPYCTDGSTCWLPGTVSQPAVCAKDQDCNGDATVSALWGKCFFGVCMCSPGFAVQTNGKCDKPAPPDCATQKGTCRQMPAECQAFEVGSARETNMSCGDFIEAVCCNSVKLCSAPGREVPGGGFTPVDFSCCAPNDAVDPPICVNGWLTCPASDTPIEKPGGCGG